MITPLDMSTEDIAKTIQMNVLVAINRNKNVEDPLYKQSLQIFKELCQDDELTKIPNFSSALFFGGETHTNKTKIVKEAVKEIAEKLSLNVVDSEQGISEHDICVQHINSETDLSIFNKAATLVAIYDMAPKDNQNKILQLIEENNGSNMVLNVQADESEMQLTPELTKKFIFIKLSKQEMLVNKIKMMREKEDDEIPSFFML